MHSPFYISSSYLGISKKHALPSQRRLEIDRSLLFLTETQIHRGWRREKIQVFSARQAAENRGKGNTI